MAEIKWIKLSTDLPGNKKIKRIRKLPDGDKVILFWVFLLARAGESNKAGGLFLTDTLPYSEEDLAADFDFSIEFVKFALLTLEKYSMVDRYEEILFIKNWEEYQAVEGMEKIREQNRLRKRKQRARQKLVELPENVDIERDESRDKSRDVTQESQSSHATDIDIEIETEIDIYSSSSKDDELRKIGNFYQDNIGQIAPNTMKDLIANYEMFGFEMVIHALTITVDSQGTYGYTKGIFQRWLKNNTKTMDDVRAKEAEFERKKSQKDSKPYNRKFQREELVPDWMKAQDEQRKQQSENKNDSQTEYVSESEEEIRSRLNRLFGKDDKDGSN